MIFRTITDDITGVNKSIGLFGRSLNDFKGIINSFKQNGIVSTLLNTPLINIDTDAIDSYNDAIKSGIPYEQALADARKTTNANTLALIESSHGAEIQTERITAAQKASTLATKASTAALKALSIAANLATMWAISKAISLAVSAWDHFNVTVKEVQENIDNLTSNIESLNAELDELNGKNNLTDAEQERLKYLETRIGLEERLLKIEQTRLAQEQLGKSTKITDWFDDDSYVKKASKEFGVYALDNDYLSNPWFNTALFSIMSDFDAYYNGAEAVIRKGNEQYEKLEYLNDKYKQLVKERDAFDVGSHDWQVGDERVARTASELEAYQKQITSESYVDLLKKYGQYTEEVENLQNILSNSEFLTDDEIVQCQRLLYLYSSNADQMNELINSIAVSLGDQSLWLGTDLELLDAKTDRLTADTIQRNFTDEEIKILAQLDFDRNASINTLRLLLKEEQETADDDPITFDLTTYKDQIDNIRSSISAFRSALDSLNSGELSKIEVIDLMQEFPDLVPFIDLTADGFGNLSEGLSKLIAQQPDSLIQNLQELKDSLSTDEERQQVDLLIDSLQCLSAYGDSGIEAYATTIGNTWNDTANVIEGVTTQFENLAKVQEAVANGLTMSATAAAELARMYPEILDYAQVTADGQITLNEEVVRTILDGDKSIVDAQITKLEADKAVLTAKKEFAEAQLNIVKQVGEGEGQISEEVAVYKLENLNKQLQAVADTGSEEDRVYSEMAENMANNMHEFNTVVGNVALNSSDNMHKAAVSMADSMGKNSINAQTSLENIQKKAWDVADAIMDMSNGKHGGQSGIYDSGGSTVTEGIKVVIDTGNFAAKRASYDVTEIDFDEFQSKLEVEIQGYTDAISNIDSQIEVLKNLQTTFDDNGGIGGHGYADRIRELEKEKDKISNPLKDDADSAKSGLASLKEELRQLELDKFNHILQDFTDQFNLRDNAKNLISQQISLFKEAGQLIGKAFYEEQISQSRKQLSLLESEKTQLVNQLTSALSSGRVQKGTDEWLEMVNALNDLDGSILDCKKSIEEFDNAILNLHWEIFDRVQDTFGSLSDEIKNLIGIMDDSDVATKDNQWTKEGLTQLGLYAQQYELATYQVSQYADEMDKLNADYLLGKYSATEYADKLADLNSEQWNAINAAENAKDSIVGLNKARVNTVTDGIKKEIDAYKKLTDAQINALDAEKDLHNYQNSITEKSKDIAKLERQLAAMQNDTTAATVAKRRQLEEQLAEARADLAETQYDHSIEARKKALNQQYEDYEEARSQEIEALEATLNNREDILAASMESVKQNTQTIATQIKDVANQYGIKVSDALTNSWASGKNPIASYGEVLNDRTSAFIGSVMGIEKQVYQLQADADTTALSLSNMFATNADNLVGELKSSYDAETNLLNMTNALQTSLTDTLQGGYDVSGIVNPLNAIADTANAIPTIGKPVLMKYASGTRKITTEQLAITNEAGQELTYQASDGSILTRLHPGDKVFSNIAAERLYQLGQGIMPMDIISSIRLPGVDQLRKSNGAVNMNYDHLIEINGDVNDTNHFIRQISDVAEKAITNAAKAAEKTRKYGMF